MWPWIVLVLAAILFVNLIYDGITAYFTGIRLRQKAQAKALALLWHQFVDDWELLVDRMHIGRGKTERAYYTTVASPRWPPGASASTTAASTAWRNASALSDFSSRTSSTGVSP
jgi:hypothetical protein